MTKYFLQLCFIFLSISMSAQVELKIEINKIKNNKGLILLELCDANNKFISGHKGTITNNTCTITIENLPAGKYCYKYFHDENNNEEMDTYWYKAPKEGYGFSNNAMGKMGPPDYEETIFEVKENSTVKCEIYYFSI